MSCPVPFLSAAEFPATGGYLPGRLCSTISPTLTCCLPCNKQSWTYTNEFNRNIDVAYWLNVPSLVALVLLLITFAVLPEKQSHRHYLNVGLCVGLSILCIAFVIPLIHRPDFCYNEITPHDMYSSNSCAFSGAFFILGTIMATAWVLARSLWIHLRLCWNFKDEGILFWPMLFVGYGIPTILWAVAMGVTTVSFRLGDTCLPGQKYPFVTYLGWLMAFGILALLLQLATTGYCLWIYLRDVIHGGPAHGTSRSGTHGRFGPAVSSIAQNGENTVARRGSEIPTARKATWRRTKVVLKTQWRSLLLSFVVSADTVLYGSIFAAQDAKTNRIMAGTEDSRIVEWATCLILNNLDPNKCRGIPNLINEKVFIANFLLAAINGMLIFLAMYRTSMAVGWWHIIRHGRRQPEKEDHFQIVPMKRRTPAQKLESDRYNPAPHEIDPTSLPPMSTGFQSEGNAHLFQASPPPSNEPSLVGFSKNNVAPSRVGQKSSFNSSPLRSNPPYGSGLLPDAPDTPDSRKPSASQTTTAMGTPEPGDASVRHGTTTWFEEDSSDDEAEAAARQRKNFNDTV